jgi:hypothetical protein
VQELCIFVATKIENRITDIQYIIDLPMGVSAFDIFFKTAIGIKFQFLIV